MAVLRLAYTFNFDMNCNIDSVLTHEYTAEHSLLVYPTSNQHAGLLCQYIDIFIIGRRTNHPAAHVLAELLNPFGAAMCRLGP